jgi:hypothetical protein
LTDPRPEGVTPERGLRGVRRDLRTAHTSLREHGRGRVISRLRLAPSGY